MILRHDTYCGLNCGACPVGMANEKDDAEKLKAMAEEWEIDLEELRCSGCKGEITAGFCRRCSIRACAIEKRVDLCGDCEEYPCGKIDEMRKDDAPHHSVIIDNMDRIKRIGVSSWLEEQNSRWSCSRCGTRFSWYQETCAECGIELYNCVSEEDDLRF